MGNEWLVELELYVYVVKLYNFRARIFGIIYLLPDTYTLGPIQTVYDGNNLVGFMREGLNAGYFTKIEEIEITQGDYLPNLVKICRLSIKRTISVYWTKLLLFRLRFFFARPSFSTPFCLLRFSLIFFLQFFYSPIL